MSGFYINPWGYATKLMAKVTENRASEGWEPEVSVEDVRRACRHKKTPHTEGGCVRGRTVDPEGRTNVQAESYSRFSVNSREFFTSP